MPAPRPLYSGGSIMIGGWGRSTFCNVRALYPQISMKPCMTYYQPIFRCAKFKSVGVNFSHRKVYCKGVGKPITVTGPCACTSPHQWDPSPPLFAPNCHLHQFLPPKISVAAHIWQLSIPLAARARTHHISALFPTPSRLLPKTFLVPQYASSSTSRHHMCGSLHNPPSSNKEDSSGK